MQRPRPGETPPGESSWVYRSWKRGTSSENTPHPIGTSDPGNGSGAHRVSLWATRRDGGRERQPIQTPAPVEHRPTADGGRRDGGTDCRSCSAARQLLLGRPVPGADHDPTFMERPALQQFNSATFQLSTYPVSGTQPITGTRSCHPFSSLFLETLA